MIILGVIFQELSALVFEMGSLTGPELTKQARLADQQVPGFHLSLASPELEIQVCVIAPGILNMYFW